MFSLFYERNLVKSDIKLFEFVQSAFLRKINDNISE